VVRERGAGAELVIGGKPKEDVALRPSKPRVASLAKSLIRKRAPRRERSHFGQRKSLDEELVLRLSLSSGRNLARFVPEKRRPRPLACGAVAGAIKEGWSKLMVEELKYSGPRW
jgi:hypothetical protein